MLAAEVGPVDDRALATTGGREGRQWRWRWGGGGRRRVLGGNAALVPVPKQHIQ